MSMSCRASRALPAALALVCLADSRSVGAHGLAARYDLPIPLDFYLVGAAAAVGLSFLMAAVFLRRVPPESSPRTLRLPRLGRIVNHRTVIRTAESLSLGFFVLLLVAGFAGNPSALRNLLPLWFWIGWWVGFATASALIGNVWPVLNPWAAVFRGADTLARELMEKYPSHPVLDWPLYCSATPARTPAPSAPPPKPPDDSSKTPQDTSPR